jgi:hypothetical protein
MKNSDDKAGGKPVLNVIVHAPRSPDPKTFVWDINMKVADAAKEAAEAFGYVGGNPGLQTFGDGGEVLDPNKTLVAEKVKDGSELELTDRSGGV